MGAFPLNRYLEGNSEDVAFIQPCARPGPRGLLRVHRPCAVAMDSSPQAEGRGFWPLNAFGLGDPWGVKIGWGEGGVPKPPHGGCSFLFRL